MNHRIDEDHFRGCLLGGAIGDALGYPIEFDSEAEILARYGPEGIRELKLTEGGKALVSDDTQMMLFTGEGILNAWENSMNPAHAIWEAYLRWYSTQGYPLASSLKYGELYEIPELHARRGPGITCLSALATGKMGNRNTILNHSKGNGTVMRVAPVGLVHVGDTRASFRLGLETGLITHGHPTASLSSGFLAAMLSEILSGQGLRESIATGLFLLDDYMESRETREAVEKALRLADFDVAPQEAIRVIGPGKVAEEALAIAIYCSLKFQDDFKEAVIRSVNHGGDSDSTGIVTGCILGAYLGTQAIPAQWKDQVELAAVTMKMADDLLTLARKGQKV